MVGLFMSCSRCMAGIQEPYKVLKTDKKDGTLYSTEYESDKSVEIGDIVMTVCSKDICGHTELVAAQGDLRQSKKERRKKAFSALGLF